VSACVGRTADGESPPGPVVPGAPRPASLTVGLLDTAAIREIREILDGLPARPWIALTVDLAAVDDEQELTLHDLTLWVLLSQAAWKLPGHGSTLTVLNPPRRLGVILRASPVLVIHRQLAAPGAS
jgi:hypothetical protein